MRVIFLVVFYAVYLIMPSLSHAFERDTRMLCGLNPVADRDMLLKQVEVMLNSPHSVELDAMTPEEIADYARVYAITVCDEKMRRNPKVFDMLQSYRVDDVDWMSAWNAWNTSCSSDKNIPACMGREVAANRAIRSGQVENPAKSRIVGFCQLAMKDHSSVNEIRHCVNQAMAVQPSEQAVMSCRFRIPYHTHTSGNKAGSEIATCLRDNVQR